MPITIYDVVRRPLVTERSMRTLEQSNTYLFDVHPQANKIQIRNAIEKLFGVKVLSVNTLNVPGKAKWSRTGGQMRAFQHKARKKAYVRLAEGHSIELV